jgi:hypothetical protein
MDFSKLMWVIQQEKLHFHRADDFEDPFEGSTPKALKQLREKSLKQSGEIEGKALQNVLDAWEEGTKESRKSIFMNCWHANDTESAAMWDLYGADEKSIAIVSTIGRMKEALEKVNRSVYLGSVVYVDFYCDLEDLDRQTDAKLAQVINRTDGKNAFTKILFKREEFAHENEIRAVFSDMSHFTDEGRNQPLYFNLFIDVDKLIERIYIAPDAPSWFPTVVQTAVQNSHLDLDSEAVQPSRLDDEPRF